MKRLLVMLLALTGCLYGCREEAHQEKEAAEALLAEKDVIVLTREQIQRGGIGFGEIGLERLSMDIRAKGKLMLPPGQDAVIGSHLDGTVTEILVRRGELVKKGTVLARMASPEILRIQQEYVSTRSERMFRKQEFERQSELRRDNINAAKALEEAKFRLADIDARYQSLRMQMELLHFPLQELDSGILSPTMAILSILSGQVEEIFVRAGMYVETNEAMFRVVDEGNLYLELRIFEKDIPFVKPGQRVTFSLSNRGDQVFEARVLSVGRLLEPESRMLPVVAAFANPDPGILAGMFASATIHTSEAMVEALPEEAVVQEADGGFWIYYAFPEAIDSLIYFHKLPVKTGFREDNLVQVELLDSLPEGAQIVTQGTYYLKKEE